MSNSTLATYKCWSPNYSDRQGNKITHIVIHHTAFVTDIVTLGNVFAKKSRNASSHYGIGNDGTIGQFVDEAYRAWTTSSFEIDKKAVTIEVSNSQAGGDWLVGDRAMKSLIKLCADICKRNGIKKLSFTGDKRGNLHAHRWYAATACPGDYLYSKFPYICDEVNKLLTSSTAKPIPNTSNSALYRVQVGAFKNKDNATKLTKQLKDKGHGSIIKQASGLYKVQVGAFGVKSNAEKLMKQLQSEGFKAYIVSDTNTTFKVGDKVVPTKLVSYTGTPVRQYNDYYFISELNGKRAVLQTDKGVTWCAMNTDNLKKV